MSERKIIFPYDLDNYTKSVFIKRPELSEDQYQILNNKLSAYKVGNIISLKYYKKGSIRHITGPIEKIDYIYKLFYVEEEKIIFSDVIEIYWFWVKCGIIKRFGKKVLLC